MRIGKIASGAEYWMDEKFQNLLVFGSLIFFRIKNSENLLIYQFGELANILNCYKGE